MSNTVKNNIDQALSKYSRCICAPLVTPETGYSSIGKNLDLQSIDSYSQLLLYQPCPACPFVATWYSRNSH